MAGTDQGTDIDALHQGILNSLASQFPQLHTIQDYPDDRRRIQSPAVLLELTEFTPVTDDQSGTEQMVVDALFELRYIVGFRGENQGRLIRRNVAAMAQFIHHQRWGHPVQPAQVSVCEPDEFSPDLDQYLVWRIEFSHQIFLGKSVFVDDSVRPDEVYVGVDPYTGPDWEHRYTRVDEIDE
jgi:hypothetical protein